MIKAIFDANLEPIIIGGGHNNCYPIIKALYPNSTPCCAINFDPHADFRAAEGRQAVTVLVMRTNSNTYMITILLACMN